MKCARRYRIIIQGRSNFVAVILEETVVCDVHCSSPLTTSLSVVESNQMLLISVHCSWQVIERLEAVRVRQNTFELAVYLLALLAKIERILKTYICILRYFLPFVSSWTAPELKKL